MAKEKIVLSSGIDTLVLSLEVIWKGKEFINFLRELKEKAKIEDKELPGVMKGNKEDDQWLFLLKPFGSNVYEWVLNGNEFSMTIGAWEKPKARPGVKVEIRSETLWRKGFKESFERVIRLIESNGAIILEVKTSRADICVDIMIDGKEFDLHLSKSMTRKAHKCCFHLGQKNDLETLEVGRGANIMGRLYNKPKEIQEKKKKKWMYDIWGIEEVPKEKRVIRVEFEIKREVLKELGLGDPERFFSHCDEGWAYCTRKWLKFEDNKDKHHRKRKPLPWWKEVQEGFLGVQEAEPAIREKAIKEDADQLRAQIVGLASSLTALTYERYEADLEEPVSFNRCIDSVMTVYQENGNKVDDFRERVITKRAKYLRQSL